jgi:hypothetical protein
LVVVGEVVVGLRTLVATIVSVNLELVYVWVGEEKADDVFM